jgi:transcriptional regulator with XRE-family HTH domain
MDIEQTALRDLLRDTFDRLQAKNPSYSLRAFSARLKTAPATVSGILRGVRKVSAKQALRILNSLPADESRKEVVLFLFKDRQRPSTPHQPKPNPLPYRVLTVAETWQLFTFPNVVVLALAETEGFQTTPKHIADRIGISVSQAAQSLRDLESMQLLIKSKAGELKPSQGAFIVAPELRLAVALQEFRRLAAMATSFGSTPTDDQTFTTTIFAMDPVQLGTMRTMLRECMVQIAMLGGSGKQKEIFQVSAQLLPISRPI